VSFADIELLRLADHFVGFWESSFTQLVISLRYPKVHTYTAFDYRHTDLS